MTKIASFGSQGTTLPSSMPSLTRARRLRSNRSRSLTSFSRSSGSSACSSISTDAAIQFVDQLVKVEAQRQDQLVATISPLLPPRSRLAKQASIACSKQAAQQAVLVGK